MTFLSLLREVVAETRELPLDQVRPESTLDELGIDSMAAAQLLVELELRLGHELPVDVLRRLDDVSTLADIAAELAPVADEAPG